MSNSGPARAHVAVVADTPLVSCRGIYVGVAGDVSITDVNGLTLVYKNAAAGAIIPIEAIAVTASGTTATNLIAMRG